MKSSTEDYVTQSPRNMSVAYHDTPNPACGMESPVSIEKMDPSESVQKSNTQNNNVTPYGSMRTSPRPMTSRAYTPLPFVKPCIPDPEITHKTEKVITPDRECIVDTKVQYVEHAFVKLPRIYSPVPYSKYSTSYSPVNWQKPIESSIPEKRKQSNYQQIDKMQMLVKKNPEPSIDSSRWNKSPGSDNSADKREINENSANSDKSDNRARNEYRARNDHDSRSESSTRCLSSTRSKDSATEDGGSRSDHISRCENSARSEISARNFNRSRSVHSARSENSARNKNRTRSDHSYRRISSDICLNITRSEESARKDSSKTRSGRSASSENSERNEYSARSDHSFKSKSSARFEYNARSEISDKNYNKTTSNHSVRSKNTARNGYRARSEHNSWCENVARREKSANNYNRARSVHNTRSNNSTRNENCHRNDNGASIDHSYRSKRSARCEKSASGEINARNYNRIRSGHSDRSENSDRKEYNARSDQSFRSKRNARFDNNARSNISPRDYNKAKSDQSARCDKSTGSDKSNRSEISPKSDQRARIECNARNEIDARKEKIAISLISYRSQNRARSKNSTRRENGTISKNSDRNSSLSFVEETQEMQNLKKVYETHLKQKKEFEEMIDKRENDLNEQLREMGELMKSIQSENEEIEKITRVFVDAMKAHTNYKNEASRVRIQHIEQEISSDILFQENEKMKEEIRELYKNINDINASRAIGMNQGTKFKYAQEILENINDEAEAETKKKNEELSSLSTALTDECIPYVKKETVVKGVDNIAPFSGASVYKTPSLKSSNVMYSGLDKDIANKGNSSPATATPQNDTTIESGRSSKRIDEQSFTTGRNEKLVRGHVSDEGNEDSEYITSSRSNNQEHSTKTDVSKPLKIEMTDGGKGEAILPKCAVKKERSLQSYIPVRQKSAVQLVSLHDDREGKSRIPRAFVQPYKSAVRDDERIEISDSSSLVMTQRKNYKRDQSVSPDQRHATKPILNPVIELDRLKKRLERLNEGIFDEDRSLSIISDETEEELDRLSEEQSYAYSETRHKTVPKGSKKTEIKSKIDTGLKTRQFNISGKQEKTVNPAMRQTTAPNMQNKSEIKSKIDTGLKNRPYKITTNKSKLTVNPEMGREAAPKRRKKNEIKSKIDTGLKNRPINLTSKQERNVPCVAKIDQSSRKDKNKRPSPEKYNNQSLMTDSRKEQTNRPELPPLRNAPKTTKTVSKIPRSSTSFGDQSLPNIKPVSLNINKRPLPRIQTANQRRNTTHFSCIKQVNQQEKNMNIPLGKKALKPNVLLPIKSLNMNQGTKISTLLEKDNRSTEIVSGNQLPKAIWISFSPSPPPKKSAVGWPRLHSAEQDDKN